MRFMRKFSYAVLDKQYIYLYIYLSIYIYIYIFQRYQEQQAIAFIITRCLWVLANLQMTIQYYFTCKTKIETHSN